MQLSNSEQRIPVIIAGALGKMGRMVAQTVLNSDDCELVGAVDTNKEKEGNDIGLEIGLGDIQVPITSDFEGSLCLASQSIKSPGVTGRAVLVDFTHPKSVYEHTRAAIAYGVHPVIGTTGLTLEQIAELTEFSSKASIGGAIIPNFSIGMVLLQQAAAAAASFYDNAELIELHHNLKADAPSGTCIKTAEMIEELGKTFNKAEVEENESIQGSRGGVRISGLNLHSIRLPGLVAHQEVIFGGKGETYTLKHDTIDRSAYMPGVLLAIHKVRKMSLLTYGLEKLL